jgi:hypothetical protein
VKRLLEEFVSESAIHEGDEREGSEGLYWVNESVKGSCNVGRCGRYFSWKISLSPRDTGSLQ